MDFRSMLCTPERVAIWDGNYLSVWTAWIPFNSTLYYLYEWAADGL